MSRIRMALFASAFAAAIHLHASAAAAADGMAARPSSIPEPARTALANDIEAYRASHPEAFAAVRDVRGHRPEVYQRARNPVPAVSRELRSLGASALLPILNALAFEAPERGSLTDQEWTALSVGLLDAVGALRDPRSGPVLRAVLESGLTKSEPVLKAAAKAMGRICGDAELATLKQHTAAGDALRGAAIQGLGQCRRIEGAEHLAALLAAAQDDSEVKAIAGALGTAASSWAWKAMGPNAEATGLAVRELAARALVQGFVRHRGEARAEMQKALLLAEHSGTPDLLAAARASADPETVVALDALAGRVKNAGGR